MEQERVARERSDNEKELLLKKVPLSSVNWGELDSEGRKTVVRMRETEI